MSTLTRRQTRLSATDWIESALEAIVRDGLAAVAVEPLAVQLGATKGSFYHHFASRDALIAAALDHWERSQTDMVFARLELIRDPAERLRAVVGAAYADREGGMRDAALFAAAAHPLVKRVVDRVTNRRLRYLTERYVELGLGRPRARRRALMVYLAYLGLFDALRLSLVRLSDAELIAYGREVLDTLIPENPG